MAGRVFRPKYTNDDGERVQQAVWWLDYSIKGKRHRESAKTEEKSEAEEILNRRLADRGKAPLRAIAEKTTFEDLCKLIRDDYERNGRKSTNRLELSIKHLSDFFEGFVAPTITEAAVERYISERLDNGYAPATVNRELAALRRMLTLGDRLRMVSRVPHIPTLNEDNARKGFFSERQLQDVLKQLPAELRPLAETAYITGWRKGEILSRDWRHVDFEASWLRLEPGETKSGEGRQFPLTDRLRAVLEERQRVRERLQREMGRIITPLFFRYDGAYKGKRVRNFHKAWSKALEEAGHPERIFHDFRRTAVRNLLSAGVPQAVAKKLTGHKTDSVFQRYAIVEESMLRDAGEKLEAAK